MTGRASEASYRLTMALLNLAERGERTHCSDWSIRHYWLSEDRGERALAVRACTGCAVLDPCGEVGRHQTFGVFGAVDVTQTPGRKLQRNSEAA
jgi:hypothetical protein